MSIPTDRTPGGSYDGALTLLDDRGGIPGLADSVDVRPTAAVATLLLDPDRPVRAESGAMLPQELAPGETLVVDTGHLIAWAAPAHQRVTLP